MDTELTTQDQTGGTPAERDAAIAELEKVNGELAAALRAVDTSRLPRSKGGATETLHRVEVERDQAVARMKELDATVEDLRGRVAYLEGALEATENSVSWWITKPLRMFKARRG
jgi:hypothetical protein